MTSTRVAVGLGIRGGGGNTAAVVAEEEVVVVAAAGAEVADGMYSAETPPQCHYRNETILDFDDVDDGMGTGLAAKRTAATAKEQRITWPCRPSQNSAG